jgi:hypothetical protein
MASSPFCQYSPFHYEHLPSPPVKCANSDGCKCLWALHGLMLEGNVCPNMNEVIANTPTFCLMEITQINQININNAVRDFV